MGSRKPTRSVPRRSKWGSGNRGQSEIFGWKLESERGSRFRKSHSDPDFRLETKNAGARDPAPAKVDDLGTQWDEARTDSPFGIRVESTMSCVSLSGSAVMRLTTTMAIRLTGMPMIPNRRWSMPIHGSMPANRTM